MNLIVAQGQNFKVRLEASNFDAEDIPKVVAATNHMADALGSDQFKEFVENYFYDETTYSGSLWWKKTYHTRRLNMRYNNGLSQAQIYEKLMSGKEVLRPETDGEADITLVLDNRNKRGVLGYTYANSLSQWVYNSFFSSGDPEVPYAVGYFVKCFKKDLTVAQIRAKMGI
jgi:hypothetical protein